MTLETFEKLKLQAHKNRSSDITHRIQRLKKLKKWIQHNQTDIEKALFADFKKPAYETQTTEIMICLNEIRFVLDNISNWTKPQTVPTPVTLIGHTSEIRFENKGVVLIIAPWNYPFQLAVMPLIAALAAGNTAVLKPSEMTEQTAQLLQKMTAEVFTESEVQCVLGGKETTHQLLDFDFDHVFFTGSTAVGKIVAEKCAKNLTPVTLELGGKSPVIIDETADIEDAVRKIHWGKFLNAGQTCVAPDTIFIHHKIYSQFITAFNKYTHSIQQQSCSMITPTHQQRLEKMGSIVSLDPQFPRLIENTSLDHPINQEEIFGPIAPIHPFQMLSDIKAFYQKNQNPLALYIFSKESNFISSVIEQFPSGGVAINTIALHLANHHLPFGGIRTSGLGRYHGYFGFLEFSHQRAVLKDQSARWLSPLLYPPYSPWKTRLIKWVQFFTT